MTADAFSQTSKILLSSLYDRLRHAIEEDQRLEAQGKLKDSKIRMETNEAMLKAIHRIEKILSRDISHQ